MASVRKSISQRVRFEIFKRDKFTCQYCGAKAPDVVLECDHIHPVAEGGESEILNLVTACKGCNGGKGARLLDDMSVVERQRLQIEELEERRQQLQMILEWRDELERLKADTVQIVSDAISARSHFEPTDRGKKDIRRWLKEYGLEETLKAMDEAFDQYYQQDDDASWYTAFRMTNRFLAIRAQEARDPLIRPILYIQGILRKRCRDSWLNCTDAVREMIGWGIDPDQLKDIAKQVFSWEEFRSEVNKLLAERRPKVGTSHGRQ